MTESWDLSIYDVCINNRVLSGTQTKDPRIKTIVINDDSIAILLPQLDTRQAYADALNVLAQSNAAVILDFQFRHHKQDDAAFVDSVSQARDPVIAAVAIDKNIMATDPSYRELAGPELETLRRHIWHIRVLRKGNIPQAGTFLLPFPELAEAAAQIAHINISPDPDGIYRRLPLLYEWEGGYIPSLPLAAAVLFYKIPIENIELNAGSYLTLRMGENELIRIPIDEQGRMLIPYCETWKDNTTVLFADIAGFTNWCSKTNPETVHSFLNDYFNSMSEILAAHNGTVDKYMGDGIIAYFGHPIEMPDHCKQCLKAAIAMQKKIQLLAAEWKPKAGINLKVRMGINAGQVIVGTLGDETRIEYTVIGTTVNLAQRMESMAAPGSILVTAAVREKVMDKNAFVDKQYRTVHGYEEPVETYTVKYSPGFAQARPLETHC